MSIDTLYVNTLGDTLARGGTKALSYYFNIVRNVLHIFFGVLSAMLNIYLLDVSLKNDNIHKFSN